MKLLFVHNNFPAQFARIAPVFAALPGMEVRAIGSRTARSMTNVRLSRYQAPPGSHATVHPFARRFDRDCGYGEQVLYAAQELKDLGFEPDVIFAHPGWGEALPLPLIFPRARLVVYAEFFYRASGADVGFDDSFGRLGLDGLIRTELRNASQLLALSQCAAAIAPTAWQKSLYPAEYRPRIETIHDGIDTELARPDPHASVALGENWTLRRADKVLTYVARGLEPMRGFHIFAAMLPALMREHPDLRVVIVGADRAFYGNPPGNAPSWREHCLEPLRGRIDFERIHLAPRLDHATLIRLFQVTRVHFYYSYPFVLSWSALEAMSCGAVLVGSDTPPVAEAISHGRTGFLSPFHDVEAGSRQISAILSAPERFTSIGPAARASVVERYDFETVARPAYLSLLQRLTGGAAPMPPSKDEAAT